ncbi:hypothetical protein DSO57_1020137 [Entomophthora muscae]|uniref:Uncharacterized protein n=1 Tax=Entomophthora muscae TaxID=34485 RepID=A0ACC2UD57_9FUNG|nr:hypothetical protein DSO57_1020137 [Entomophthora muscae]
MMSADNTVPQQVSQSEDLSHLNKTEKKARKALEKLGMSPVSGITRVVFRRPKGMMLAVTEPQVFKNIEGNTYIILGEAKVEDLNQQAQLAAQERLRQAEGQNLVNDAAQDSATEDEEQDESGIDSKDIELVMQQASVSRAKAIKALRANNLDMVNTIMDLTT